LKKLHKVEINFYCTDNWRAFAEVLPKERHIIGKKYTKNIEGDKHLVQDKAKKDSMLFKKTALPLFYQENRYL